jgi:quercetin dioxygenase-like cupin family protein
MKKKSKISGVYFLVPIVFIVAYFFVSNETYAQTEESFNVLEVKTEIDEGKDREMKVLFEGERRKIIQITLRNNKRLNPHSTGEPIMIQCVAGSGELIIEVDNKNETIELTPGLLVTINGNVVHDVAARPSVSILLTRFIGEM